MKDEEQIEAQALRWRAQIAAAADVAGLEAARAAALGKKSALAQALRGLGARAPETRARLGARLNRLKRELAGLIAARARALQAARLDEKLHAQSFDVSLPVRAGGLARGRIHPVWHVMDEITALFVELGFAVEEGPEVETDYYNFEALNIPPGHPARADHDTFYFAPAADGRRALLRTHTSPVQIRAMERGTPPFRFIAPGRTFRRDSDQTHTPMFHQVEGLAIDRGIHLGHLKWVLSEFLGRFFERAGIEIRFRPHFFPFTEPSLEADIRCTKRAGRIEIGGGDDWLEILGCGMVHPNVLAAAGVDPKRWQGFAFGLGVDRLAMLKYAIPDLRGFFDADLNWLRRYGFSPLDGMRGGGGR